MSNKVTSMLLQQMFLFLKMEKFCQHHFFIFLQGILCFHKMFPFSIRKWWFRYDAMWTTSFNTLIIMIRQQWFETWFIKTSITIARETQFETLHFNLIGQFILLDGGTGGHVYVSIRNGENEENWKTNMVPTWGDAALRLLRMKTQERGR